MLHLCTVRSIHDLIVQCISYTYEYLAQTQLTVNNYVRLLVTSKDTNVTETIVRSLINKISLRSEQWVIQLRNSLPLIELKMSSSATSAKQTEVSIKARDNYM